MCYPHEIADNAGRCALVLLRGKSWCFLAQCVQCGSSSKNNDKRQAIIKHAINTMLKPKMRPVSLPPKTVFCKKLTNSANQENALKRIYAAPGGGGISTRTERAVLGWIPTRLGSCNTIVMVMCDGELHPKERVADARLKTMNKPIVKNTPGC